MIADLSIAMAPFSARLLSRYCSTTPYCNHMFQPGLTLCSDLHRRPRSLQGPPTAAILLPSTSHLPHLLWPANRAPCHPCSYISWCQNTFGVNAIKLVRGPRRKQQVQRFGSNSCYFRNQLDQFGMDWSDHNADHEGKETPG